MTRLLGWIDLLQRLFMDEISGPWVKRVRNQSSFCLAYAVPRNSGRIKWVEQVNILSRFTYPFGKKLLYDCCAQVMSLERETRAVFLYESHWSPLHRLGWVCIGSLWKWTWVDCHRWHLTVSHHLFSRYPCVSHDHSHCDFSGVPMWWIWWVHLCHPWRLQGRPESFSWPLTDPEEQETPGDRDIASVSGGSTHQWCDEKWTSNKMSEASWCAIHLFKVTSCL